MPNHLASASSPYLRQHRDNPVDWYQWGQEAFDEAQRTGKPILLSVGYSACHWCHVMAHESFEDTVVASLMNSLFVNVKVDREERPDVDAVYMDAVQALTGRGGWPMTVFCTPTGEPFYGGTYYPREAFIRLLSSVDDAWNTKRLELQQNVDALIDVIGRTASIAPASEINAPSLVNQTVSAVVAGFDPRWGGFGTAPKFPSTFALDLALQTYVETKDESLAVIVRTSLDAMASGGIYDHIGGGFSRYSVDERWLVPHFEKMLYDQALLLRVYVHAWQVFRDDKYRLIVEEIIQYVLRDLTHSLGGFFSAEDADSLDIHGHSEEGAFYTWSTAEVLQLLGDQASKASEWYDISESGNFEGLSIPNRIANQGQWQRPAAIEKTRQILFNARETRHRPGLDDKVLTEWNAMMLSSLCEAAAAFDRDDWREAALKNGNFLISHLRDDNGVWSRSWQHDALPQARHSALAHDLAHVIDAMTRLYELTAQHQWLQVATDAAEHLIRKHWDDQNGGLFTVGITAEQLIVRQKDIMDNATPSANSVAALSLLRLGALTGNQTLSDHAEAILFLLAKVAPTAPTGFCHAISTINLWHNGVTEIVIPGQHHDFLSAARSQWRPKAVTAWGEPTPTTLWEGREPGLAYVCRGHVCAMPASTVEELMLLLTTND